MTAVAETTEDAADQNAQFLTFVLNGENYGIDILQIREIIELGSLTDVPLMPDYIAGVINLRGAVVPVVNLARRFEQEAHEVTKKTSIIIIELEDNDEVMEIGIIVDLVNEVLDLGAEDIAAPPTFGAKVRADFIRGMGRVNDQLMILLDVTKVLSLEELAQAKSLGETSPPSADAASGGAPDVE